MTVVVGILNTKGAAIAADSAVTRQVAKLLPNGNITDKKEKIVNSGNKMLRISDIMPIGVMVVNNASLLDVPWDVIIRWYRKQHGETTYATVEELVVDFLDFIPKQEFFIKNAFTRNWPYPTELVFTGYGIDQKYPQLVHLRIRGVENCKLIYTTKDVQIHNITEENPSLILSFGQKDIVATLTEDMTENSDVNMLYDQISMIFSKIVMKLINKGILKSEQANYVGYAKEIIPILSNYHKEERSKWEKSVKDYSLQQMAALAENLVNATELHRQITFEEEHVGGLIDLAIITKADGFQWLNRKSWYYPSRGGQYGKFGV